MNTEIRLTHEMLIPGFRKDSYVIMERVRAMKGGFMLILYKCLCDCGVEKLLRKNDLQGSKGCSKCRFARGNPLSDKYPVGLKKNSYTVLEKIEKRQSRDRMFVYYKCRCDCGIEKVISRSALDRSEGCIECRVKRFEGRLGKKKVSE